MDQRWFDVISVSDKIDNTSRVLWDAAENSDESKSQVFLSDVSR